MGALTDHAAALAERGWIALPPSPDVTAWVAAARPVAERILADPEQRRAWLRCGGTWFAGVGVFPNGPDGAARAEGVPPLGGPPVRLAEAIVGGAPIRWDRAQISVCFPGYPQPSEGESDAAFRFRLRRDAAHVDGLLPETGPDGRRIRRPGERHAFILGIPLGATHPRAAPLVVWEGSHRLIRAALAERLSGLAPEAWPGADVTEAYTGARARAFETCRRVPVTVPEGGACLVHRLAVHGVAPWTAPEGPPRAIAYFRPEPPAPLGPRWWLEAP